MEIFQELLPDGAERGGGGVEIDLRAAAGGILLLLELPLLAALCLLLLFVQPRKLALAFAEGGK
jgi:hypothetical protein